MSISKGILRNVASYQASSKAMKEKIGMIEEGFFCVDSMLHDHKIEYRKNKEAVQKRIDGVETDYQREVASIRKSLNSAANVRLYQSNRIEELYTELKGLTEYVSKLWLAVSILSGIVTVMLLYILWLIYYGI